MSPSIRRVAMISMHTPPAQQAGTGDSGGLNVSLLATARELAARGVEVELLTRVNGEPGETLVSEGVMQVALAAGPPSAKSQLANMTDEFGEAVAQRARQGGRHYDVIHAHYWLSGLAALPVALELGIPMVQSFHTLAAMKNRTLGPDENPEPERRLLTERYLSRQASIVVAGSVAEVDCLIDEVGASAEKVWLVPPGVDVDLFTPERADAADAVRTAYGIEAGHPLLAVVGRVQPLKDQELAIRALAHSQSGAVLVIAGEPTPGEDGYLRRLRALVDELGISDRVRFVGALAREPLADLLAAASLTVVPSRSETFGLVALESAASGTPVVGYRGTGLVESVDHGRSGWLVDDRDPLSWATVIDTLLGNSDGDGDTNGLEQLSLTAREHALGFTWAATATALLGLYSSLG